MRFSRSMFLIETLRESERPAPAFHRTEPQLSRLGGFLYLLQSLRQQFLFPQVLRHGNGALYLLTRLKEPSHFHQQISADTVKQMIASQRRVSSGRGYSIECIKASGR